MNLQNKVVLITGSSSGIGQATAIRFAREGAIVVINYKTNSSGAEETLDKIKTLGGNALVIQGDISQEQVAKDLIEQIVKKFGQIDIVINNAGRYEEGDEWNGNEQVWESTLKNCLISVMNVSKYAIQEFVKRQSGTIVSISSRYSVSGQYEALAYAASKAAIVNITQAYAKLLAPFGRANCISPGAVKTGYWTRASQDELDAELDSNPLHRLAELEDIVEGIVYLASENSRMVTGQNIIIDGGSTLR